MIARLAAGLAVCALLGGCNLAAQLKTAEATPPPVVTTTQLSGGITQTTTVTPGAPAPAQVLASFTTADLQAALADAQSAQPPDTAAIQCFSYLLTEVPIIQAQLNGVPGLGNSASSPGGAFTVFEVTRVGVNNIKGFIGGVPAGLNMACAPLILDAENTALGLAAQLGIKVAIPATAAIP